MAKVVIIVKGGCVQDVYASPELQGNTEFVILDRDNEGEDPEEENEERDYDAEVDKAIEGLVAVA